MIPRRTGDGTVGVNVMGHRLLFNVSIVFQNR